MNAQADPYQLRYIANCFSSGAQELQYKATRLEGILQQIVSGSSGWKGEGAQSFVVQGEVMKEELLKVTNVLDRAVTVLNRLALQMERVHQLRTQANMLEQQSWEYGGDSIDDLHHRQNLAREAARLHQEADLEASIADSQASTEFYKLLSMIPLIEQLIVTTSQAQTSSEDEPWYEKLWDKVKEEGHQFAVEYEKHWTTGNMWYDELNYWTLGIPEKFTRVFHTKPFSWDNLVANLDLFVSVVPAMKWESGALEIGEGVSATTAGKVASEETVNAIEAKGSNLTLEEAKALVQNGTDADKLLNDIVDGLATDIKGNPLRQAYEQEVAGLKERANEMMKQGLTNEEIARTLNLERRELGVRYKDATPPLLREYIYEVNMQRYGDKLGPSIDYLINKYDIKTDSDFIRIIDSSTRPNPDVNALLGGFKQWLAKKINS